MFREKNGFTLLELIVVIAIIATLATIVVLQIDSPKNKTADAAVKAQMKEIAAQAQAYAIDNNGNFLNMCTVDSIISAALNQITKNSTGPAKCETDLGGQNWAVSADLKGGGKWCLDSFGFMGDGEASSGQCL